MPMSVQQPMTYTVQSMDLDLVKQGQDGRDVFLGEQPPVAGSPCDSSTGCDTA